MHVLLQSTSTPLILCVIALNINSVPREGNTLIITSEQVTTAKWGCANVSSNTSSRA